MPRLSLSVLGTFQASLDGQTVTGFESNKVRALLAFLAVESDRPHARETLVGMLWPDYPGNAAFRNLRSALANLRKAIGDPQATPPFLLITRDTIQFNRASDHSLDLAILRDLSKQPMEQIEQSVAAYIGPFLEGFSLADSPEFEAWLLARREQIRRDVVQAFNRLAAHCQTQGAYPEAIRFARQGLALEPWDEEAHRLTMVALAHSGQRTLALTQFEDYHRMLRQELGVEPSHETVTLAEAIRHETLPLAGQAFADNQIPPVEPPAPGDAPFKGLDFYDETDADLFFGRAAVTADLANRVRALTAPEYPGYRILTVIGASGSGKSSIVRAGLVPALRPVFGEAIHLFTPTAQPLETLSLSLTCSASTVTAAAALLDALREDPRTLHLAATRLAQQSKVSRLLLVVDQFEELFTLCRDERERRSFLDTLLYAARTTGPTAVIIALRADFYANCAPYEDLRQALCESQEYIGAMTATELRQAIEEPARQGGWRLEPALIDLLLRDVGQEPGALPLLSHALLETWHRRRGRTLTLTGYQATGGVLGAIALTAETTFQQLTLEQQVIARNIFLRLTELGSSNGEDAPELYTRRRVALAELVAHPDDPDGVQRVLGCLADARLVTVGQETVEVAHEALIREWGRLLEWLRENRAGLRLHRQITETAQEWEQLGRDAGILFRGARLAQAVEWAETHGAELNRQEQAFLVACQAEALAQVQAEAERHRRELQTAQALANEQSHRAEEQAQAASKLRRRALVLAVASTGLVLLLVAAIWLGQSRQTQERLATSRELAAAAVTALQIDPERSVLLGLQAVATADTLEARNALHQALPELHSTLTIAAHQPGGAPGVSYSPDGQLLASIGVDGTAKVWDAKTGELVRTLSGDPDIVGFHIVFSPNGKLLAASWQSQVLVWDVDTWAVRLRLAGTAGGMTNRLAFSSDSARLAVANIDGQPRIWEMTTGSQVLALTGHEAVVDSVAYSPNGRRLATGDFAGIVKIWNANSGQEVASLVHGGWVHGLAFSPDGRTLAAAGEDGRLMVWDTESGATVMSLPTRSGLYDVAFMPDGQQVLTVHQDGTAVLWDSTTGQQLLTFAGHLSTVISAAASPDNIHVATSGYDSTVRIWDTRPGYELLTTPAHRGPAYAIDYSPDGKRLATAGADGAAKLWDPVTGLLALTLFSDVDSPGFASIAFSPDGSRVAAGGVDGTVLIGDPVTGLTELVLPAHGDMVWAVTFSPDGRRLVTTSWDKTTRQWDLETAEEISAYVGHSEIAFGAAFSPDGARIYTSSGRTTRELDAATGEELRRFPDGDLDVYGVALSPDGRVLAQGRSDGSVALLDVATGETIRTLTGHGGIVIRLAFSQDGSRLVTASFDKFAKLWEVESGQELATYCGHGGNVFGADFSPSSGKVATVGGDGTLRLYTLDPDELVNEARLRVSRSLTQEECQRFLHLSACPP